MLQVSNINKSFHSTHALNGCSLTANSNKITAIVGPNGAGKTTLFNIVSGYTKPDSGSILLSDNNLRGLRPHDIYRLGVARTWQQVNLFKSLLVWQHLVIAENNNDSKIINNLIHHENTPWQRYKKHLKDYGLDNYLKTQVGSLSFGQSKLLQLAMVLLRNNQLILLDEPIAGVNHVVQQRIEKILLNLKKRNRTLVLIEHNIEFVKKIADKVIVLNQGKVLAEGKPTEIFNNQKVINSYLGT
jgi:branched-chain amino acid transport system ATP-binding protein